MKIKDFGDWKLLESFEKSRFKSISKDEFNSMVNDNCRNYEWSNPRKIIRGSRYRGEYLYSTDLGRSETTRDIGFYNKILECLPSWKTYASRNKSIIGLSSDELNMASGVWPYGNCIYEIFPFDGSKLNHCRKDDFWNIEVNKSGFGGTSLSIISFSHFLNIIYKSLYGIGNLEDFLQKMDALESLPPLDLDWGTIRVLEDFLKQKSTGSFKFIDYLDEILNPTHLGVKKIDTSIFNWQEDIPHAVETWTEGPVLMQLIKRF